MDRRAGIALLLLLLGASGLLLISGDDSEDRPPVRPAARGLPGTRPGSEGVELPEELAAERLVSRVREATTTSKVCTTRVVLTHEQDPVPDRLVEALDPDGYVVDRKRTNERGEAILQVPWRGAVYIPGDTLYRRLRFPLRVERDLWVIHATLDRWHGDSSISGVVFDKHGRPAGQVLVSAYDADNPGHAGTSVSTDQSDEKGKFEITNLPEGEFRLLVLSGDPSFGVAPTDRVVAAGSSDIEIQLTHGRQIHVYAKDAETRSRVPGFYQVEVWTPAGWRRTAHRRARSATTQWDIPIERDGTRRIRVDAPGYKPSEVTIPRRGGSSSSVYLERDSSERVEVRLEVVDERGVPFSSVRLHGTFFDREFKLDRGHATISLVAGQPEVYTVIPFAKDPERGPWLSERLDLDANGGETTSRRFVFERAGWLVLGKELPIKGAQLMLARNNAWGHRHQFVDKGKNVVMAGHHELSLFLRTGETAVFFVDVRPGDVTRVTEVPEDARIKKR